MPPRPEKWVFDPDGRAWKDHLSWKRIRSKLGFHADAHWAYFELCLEDEVLSKNIDVGLLCPANAANRSRLPGSISLVRPTRNICNKRWEETTFSRCFGWKRSASGKRWNEIGRRRKGRREGVKGGTNRQESDRATTGAGSGWSRRWARPTMTTSRRPIPVASTR